MRVRLGFDPGEHEYGPATASVRAILRAWAEIDWFEPVREDEAEARRLFHEHNALAREHSPVVFAERVEVRCEAGGWEQFGALCEAVRSGASWDWKISILKNLSSDHARARGWSLDAQEARPVDAVRPGDLFCRWSEDPRSIFWNRVGEPFAELEALPRPEGEAARFYYGYAQGDVLDCVKWQLAEGHDDVRGNPFRPLLLCYRAGFYPFSFGRAEAALFRFERRARAPLPKATLIKRRR